MSMNVFAYICISCIWVKLLLGYGCQAGETATKDCMHVDYINCCYSTEIINYVWYHSSFHLASWDPSSDPLPPLQPSESWMSWTQTKNVDMPLARIPPSLNHSITHTLTHSHTFINSRHCTQVPLIIYRGSWIHHIWKEQLHVAGRLLQPFQCASVWLSVPVLWKSVYLQQWQRPGECWRESYSNMELHQLHCGRNMLLHLRNSRLYLWRHWRWWFNVPRVWLLPESWVAILQYGLPHLLLHPRGCWVWDYDGTLLYLIQIIYAFSCLIKHDVLLHASSGLGYCGSLEWYRVPAPPKLHFGISELNWLPEAVLSTWIWVLLQGHWRLLKYWREILYRWIPTCSTVCADEPVYSWISADIGAMANRIFWCLFPLFPIHRNK